MRQNKIMKVNDITWKNIVKEMANEYGVCCKLIEESLLSVLTHEQITKIKKSTKYRTDIIEIINEPSRKCTTLYNTIGFVDEYKNKTRERFSKKGLMRTN